MADLLQGASTSNRPLFFIAHPVLCAMSRSLWECGLDQIQERLIYAPGLSLFLNFDGTLAPWTEDPDEARLDDLTRCALEALSKRSDVLTVILSGRSLADIQPRVGIPGLVYAGNHGLEISGRGMHFIDPFAAARRDLLARVSESLAANLKGILGVRVEYKGLTVSVHYRQAQTANMLDIEKIVQAVVAPRVSPFYLDVGKMALDVIPRTDWHKGAAVCWINSRLGNPAALSIYAGDDRTDEIAFRTLSDAITICVGNSGWTSAKYAVADAADLREFLFWLDRYRAKPSSSLC